jgi:cleavage stimulation factor subunit 2
VNNFRLVHDKETGRPKGFGFLEFADPDAAASAVRNLNDHEIMGRKLRVDWSNDNSGGGGNTNTNDNSNNNNNNNMQQSHPGDSSNQQPPMLPPLPPGTDLPAGLTCPDAISKTLSAIPAPQLLDIISQMKGLVMSDPNQATELLRQAPQLAYAIFQALLLLGLVDTSMLSSIVQASAPQNPQFPASAPVPPPPMPQPPQAAYAPTPQPGYPGYPQQQQYHQPTPPVQQPAFAPPPPPQQAAASQQDLIAQVLSMTIDQINQLDPVSRQQIIALRAQLGAPVA